MGPSFLWKPQIPKDQVEIYDLSNDDPEVRKVTVHVAETVMAEFVLSRLVRFSKWSKAVAAITVLVRCIRTKHGAEKTHRPVEDRHHGEMAIIRLVQREPFEITIKALKNLKPVLDKDLCKLDPFIDDVGVLRVGGRLVRSTLIDSVKHPIILPNPRSTNHVVLLIIKHHHERIAHQGRGFTINELRGNVAEQFRQSSTSV
jgi:hypothetical protein